ncbi:M29 family metallopeptidase [Peristeroidobacter soli]|uniref:2,5-dihydroxypyridine 5,6-dioxygenase n=1 Tax=Peristeroidobacter soli TaxID=2497877 RepID=UPI001FEA7546|nr:2,5-dihydroxypyridine 5,6-dioxygenase [Peristeroidobacter soli]
MAQVDVDMLRVFTAELELCKVKAGESVAVLSAGTAKGEIAQTFMIAAQKLGAAVFHVNIPDLATANAAGVVGRSPLAGNRRAVEALKSANMVIDLLGMLFSAEQLELQAAGVRILLVVEPLHILKQMFPTVEHRRRVEAAEKLLKKARELRVTSAAGTDVRYRLQQYPVMTQYGYTDTPGRWDHWPSAFLFTNGNDGEVDGTVVLAPGDILCAFKRYVQEPVTLTIERGFITRIDGKGMDAALIRDYMESFRDPRAYAISHIGWGMHERATWYHMLATQRLQEERIMNALSFYGNVLFSTGPNTELGGTNDTACHLDIPLRNCNLFLDGEQILDTGKIAVPELRAAGWQ